MNYIWLTYALIFQTKANLSNCGYFKVRHLPVGSNAWHNCVDHLAGTCPAYGDPQDDTAPWNILFQNFIFDQFAFTAVDLSVFMIATKEQINGSGFNSVSITILRSSNSPNAPYLSVPIQSNVLNDNNHPHLALTDKGKDTIYCGNQYASPTRLLLLTPKGNDVYVRKGQIPENEFCLTPTGVYCSQSKFMSLLQTTQILLDFDATASSISASNTFITDFQFQCGYQSCSLFEQGCEVPNSSSSKITMVQTSPWVLTFPQNIQQGWEETKCIVCTVETSGIIFKFNELRIKQFSNQLIYCNWKKVKYLPIGSIAWHQGNDHLAGIVPSYGDPTVDTAAWGMYFQNFIFNQFAFATVDLSMYMIGTKLEIIGSEYTNLQRTFLRTSNSPSLTYLSVGGQYNRNNILTDPHISLTSITSDTMYQGNSNTNSLSLLTPKGNYVLIREAPPTEFEPCLSPSRFNQDLSFCYFSLVPKDIFFKIIIIGSTNILKAKQEIFRNFDPFNCPITKCVLKNNDCTQVYTGSEITMNNDFDIFINSYTFPSPPIVICIECLNSHMTIQKREFKILYDDYIPTLCSSSLISNAVTEKILAFGAPQKVVSAKNSDIFSNSQPDICPMSSCQLMNSNCVQIYSNLGIIIKKTGNLDISLTSTSIPEGQKFQICIQCSNLYQVIQKLTFKIIQMPHICLNTLATTSLLQQEVEYLSLTKVVQIRNEIITNSDEINCPMVCQLLNSDCLSVYDSPLLKMNTNNDYEITFKSTEVLDGQAISVCIQCQNGIQTLKIERFTAIQLPASKCYTSLIKSSVISITISYGDPLFIVFADGQLFLNSNPDLCPITRCELLTPDCSQSLSTTNLMISQTDNFKIYLLTSQVITGQSIITCVKCKNQKQSIELKTFEVVQLPKSTIQFQKQIILVVNEVLTIQVSNLIQEISMVEILEFCSLDYLKDLGELKVMFSKEGKYAVNLEFLNVNGQQYIQETNIIVNQIPNQINQNIAQNQTTSIEENVSQIAEQNMNGTDEKMNIISNNTIEQNMSENKDETDEQLIKQIESKMLNQNMKRDFLKMSNKQKDQMVEYIVNSNFTRTQPYIESISNKGLMKVRFIQNLPFINISMLNSSNIEMYIDPSQTNTYENINFTWDCVSFQPKVMDFQLYFISPVDISPLLPFDMIYFVTKDNFTIQNLTLTSNIKPQLGNLNETSNSEKIGKAVETTMKVFGGINFAMSIWLQGILHSLLGVIQSLAIVVHFPLLNIPTPSNVLAVNTFLVPIVTFEMLDSAFTSELVFDFEYVKQELLQQTIPEQYADMGYDTHNSILNMGSTFIFTIFYAFCVVIAIITKLISIKFGVGLKLYNFMKKKLFFGFIIQVFISSFMEILIAGYLNLKAPIYTQIGESTAVFFSYFSLVTALLILPVTYIWVINRPINELENPNFKERWGTFYQVSKLSSHWNLLFNFFSLVRRFQFIFFVLFVPVQSLQIISILTTNMMITVYQAVFKPLKSIQQNRLELFNEYLIFMLSVLLITFSEFVEKNQTRHDMGEIQIFILGIYIFTNLLFIFKGLLLSLYLIYRKMTYKRQWANLYGIPMTAEEVEQWTISNQNRVRPEIQDIQVAQDLTITEIQLPNVHQFDNNQSLELKVSEKWKEK